MENLILSFNIVLPLFLCIALGYFLRRIKLLKEDIVQALNKLTFKVFLPVYLFNNVYSTNLSEAWNGRLVLFSVTGVIGLFLLLLLIIPLLEKDPKKRGVMIQGIFRSNFALFGLPLAISLCGEEKAGPTALLVALVVPVYNVLAVLALEIYRGGKPNFVKILRGIVTNPLIIASLIGVILNLLPWNLPAPFEKACSDIGKVATPLSLVALGGSFVLSEVRKNLRPLLLVLSGKLILAPLLLVTIAVLLGFRNETLVPVMIMFGAPIAVSSYPMAQQMDGDGELAGQLVVLSSGLCILTIFLWIFALKQLSLI